MKRQRAARKTSCFPPRAHKSQCYGKDYNFLCFNLRFIPLIRFPPFYSSISRTLNQPSSRPATRQLFFLKIISNGMKAKSYYFNVIFLFVSCVPFVRALSFNVVFLGILLVLNTGAREDETKMFFFLEKVITHSKIVF